MIRIIIIVLLCSLSFLCNGQTIVSTSEENKKIVLEQFTGINCVFCPNANTTAEGIRSNNPENAFIINIHQGGLANPSSGQPDFRTPFGDLIADQATILGYPAGTINRHVFPGQSQSGGNDTAMSRTEWLSAANQTLNEVAYVNLAMESEVNVQSRELDIDVETYFTGNSPASTNMLNVALLQNKTIGPQAGANGSENYEHNYRLIHLITGQWGESISPTTQGTFIDRNYQYTIPLDYNGISVALDELELVVFVTETTQEIANGNGSYPSYFNLPLDLDVNLEGIAFINDQCGIDFGPSVQIQNNGNTVLNTIDFEYSINGGTLATWTWTGSLDSFQTEMIELPPIAYSLQESNTVVVSVAADEDNTNNIGSASFQRQELLVTPEVNLILNTNASGGETNWTLRNPLGAIIASGGPYPNNTSITENFLLADVGCHEFKLSDAGGNGSGSVVLYDSENTVIYQSPGNYGAGAATSFLVEDNLSSQNFSLEKLVISPNPVNTHFTVSNAVNSQLTLFDLGGKELIRMKKISEKQKVQVENLPAGTYFLRIENDAKVSIKRILIQK